MAETFHRSPKIQSELRKFFFSVEGKKESIVEVHEEDLYANDVFWQNKSKNDITFLENFISVSRFHYIFFDFLFSAC